MQRGNLIVYDTTGKIFYQSGEAEGDVYPHEYPIGIPYIELPYETMIDKRALSVDVSATLHRVIFEVISRLQTEAEKIAELENQVLLMSEVLV